MPRHKTLIGIIIITEMSTTATESKGANLRSWNDDTKKVDYDELLTSAGEFGKYQIWLICCASPAYIFGAFIYFSQMFLTQVSVNHWCWIPELENLTVLERRTLAIPFDNESIVGYSRCSAYVANWSDVLATREKPDSSWKIEKCQHGWEFDKTEIPYSTISSELGWVCNHDNYQATAQTLFFVGCIIGGFLIGWVSDKFGRLPAAAVANIFGCVGGIASTFATTFWEFTLCRIIMGIAYDNGMMMIYLLILEFTVPKYRSAVSNMSFAICFTIGIVSLPWIALACNDWKVLSLVTSLPLALAILAPFILPESPRWLLSKGKIEDVIKNIYIIGESNKKEISSKMVEQFRRTATINDNESDGNMMDVMKSKPLRNMFICICLEYFCCMAVFDASVRTIEALKFDFFISFTVISLTELPSILLLSFIIDRTGRKWLSIPAMTICALFSFITPFVGGGLPSVICSVIARFCVNMGCNAILQWSAELMPNTIRGTSTSIVHITGYVATGIAPFIAYLDNYLTGISQIVIGVIALIGAMVSLFLPETANKELPKNLDDALALIRTKKIFDFLWFNRNNSSDTGNLNRL